jgi:NAD+ diphosphatase
MISHSIDFEESLEGWWCLVHEHKMYLPAPLNKIPHGRFDDLALPVAEPKTVHKIGEIDDSPVYILDDITLNNDDDFLGLRTVLFNQPEMFEFVSRAYQVDLFLRTHKYCGQCGQPMELVDWELATLCKPCRHRCYPRISPCIIVAIRNQDKILLAKGTKSTSGLYSILAGFVESGESLEQAVHREVFEEVGIKIKNIRYFGSQPWPFPHSLMMGFTAEYESGDINICEEEILAADWFDLDSMPQTPPVQSISGQLIETTKQMMRLAKR